MRSSCPTPPSATPPLGLSEARRSSTPTSLHRAQATAHEPDRQLNEAHRGGAASPATRCPSLNEVQQQPRLKPIPTRGRPMILTTTAETSRQRVPTRDPRPTPTRLHARTPTERSKPVADD